MATPDTQMNIYLTAIANAIKGKDVRSAIHDGLEKAYNDAYSWYNLSVGNSQEALSKATSALDTITQIADDLDDIEQQATEIEQSFDAINARVDNIIAHNNDTEGNTELIDIRSGYDGYTAGSAGSSVRRQVNAVNTRITQYLEVNPRSQVPLNAYSSITYEALWTNANPTSNFSAGSISYTLPSNTMYLVLAYKPVKSENKICYQYLPILPDTEAMVRIDNATLGTYGPGVNTRTFTVPSRLTVRGSITVSNNVTTLQANPFDLYQGDLDISDLAGYTDNDNSMIIPYKLYAVKYSISTTMQVSKDSELIDARIGVDGTVYESLGDAIRQQIAQCLADGSLDT